MLDKKWLYHITHYSNLPSIFAHGGLVAYSMIKRNRVPYVNIAHARIQDKRSTTFVPLPPHGILHDYVPFYFAPKSPMLYAIHKGRVEGYEKGQDEIVYLVSRTDLICRSGLAYMFTDGHAIMGFTDFYNDLMDLNKIDWEVMQSQFWFDTEEDPDRKRRRQAEFLVHQFVPVELIVGIAVKHNGSKQTVEKLLQQCHYDKQVAVRPHWYY
ncbi:MAG: DUF4433 domain-containing protein [Anoxybacillus sp.]|nr:DUF4433 domain-containing protein [Anoxybacillus sp.]MCL6586707.1 DUF4433 domain-containing protein [Anoxybacillus sp.]